jgi:hypothetical protein
VTHENSSTVRSQGVTELRTLARTQQIRIYFAERRLPLDEFTRKLSQAWITWSPEGFGWDCIRHYEAAAAYSVPLMSRPSIIRYHPFLEGVHAIYYDPDIPGNLTQVVRRALEDRARLKSVALAAREHIVTHHLTPWVHGEQLLRYGLGLAIPPGGLEM